ncbi:hypothetical protein K3888_03125 [Dietzia aurantiaca]|uniref:Uncharacterized protein n=1 Tax=Dietzia aurantiaca TaxID=983873 RepID=A0ABV9PQ63_9ACTN|nr:hypothetical protein [Dietzia aurantiaca]MCD2261684.1 hypothetical protein [Dietzia aurantiaca]
MESHESPDTEVEPRSGQQPAGSSRGEVISMVLFGLMVIIASVCFVIW